MNGSSKNPTIVTSESGLLEEINAIEIDKTICAKGNYNESKVRQDKASDRTRPSSFWRILFVLVSLANVIVGISIPLYFILTFTLKSSPFFLLFCPLIILRITTPETLCYLWKKYFQTRGKDRHKTERKEEDRKVAKEIEKSDRIGKYGIDGKSRVASLSQSSDTSYSWRLFWLGFSPMLLCLFWSFNFILEEFLKANKSTFHTQSHVFPLGSDVSPRILVRGNWMQTNTRINLPEGPYFSQPKICSEFVGWGDREKWTKVAAQFWGNYNEVRNRYHLSIHSNICSFIW